MDDISTRTIIIAVNIFVTITIVSLLIIMFGQMGDIYGIVINTDTSIASRFDDIHSMYHGRTETGIGLLNTLKTFEEDNEYQVDIIYPGSDVIRTHIDDYNSGKDEKDQKREVQVLKQLMSEEGTNEEPIYSIKRDIGAINPRYEDKYNITVSEREDGKLEINFNKVN